MKLSALIACGCAIAGLAKKAFIIVDTQECFLEQGSLPVVASQIIHNLNDIRNTGMFDLIVLTQDFHPQGHISFGTAHGMEPDTPNAEMSNSWRGAMTMKCVSPGEGDTGCCPLFHINQSQVTCNGIFEYCPDNSPYSSNVATDNNPGCAICKETPEKCFEMTMDLWLDHCLHDGDSIFARALLTDPTDKIVQKGFRHMEMFSGFFDNTRTYHSDLHQTLQDADITEIFVAGIATTHCVRWTVQDALYLGYKTNVIMDASAGIWGTPTSYANETEAIADFEKQGITVLNTEDVLEMASPTCGEIKKMYKSGDCCGMPDKKFHKDSPARRLGAKLDAADLEEQIAGALEHAKATGGAVAAQGLASKLRAVVAKHSA